MSYGDTVDDFFKFVNDRDLVRLGNLLTEGAESSFPKTRPLVVKGLVFQVQRTIIQGSWAAVHWTNQGISRRQEPYENEGVTLLEIEGVKSGL